MRPKRRQELLRSLTAWEAEGWLDEKLERVAQGKAITQVCSDHLIPIMLFFEWIDQEPARQLKLDAALKLRAELRERKRKEAKAEDARTREAVKLYFVMQRASKDAWESAGRLLKIALPPRPGDYPDI